MEAVECEICYENAATINCSKCGCKYCANCFLHSYNESFEDDVNFKCINCNNPISLYTIYKALNKDSTILSQLIKRKVDIRLEQLKLESHKLSRCVNAIKLRNKYQELMKTTTKSRINEIIEYKEIVGKFPKDATKEEIELIGLYNNSDVFKKKRSWHTNLTIPISIQDILTTQYKIMMKQNLGASAVVKYIFQCDNPDCKNGLVSNEYMCVLCGSEYCKSCWKNLTYEREKKNITDHVCDPNDVATVNQLIDETKPCPKCACRTKKVSGCAHVFCNNCHTSFDWNTNRISPKFSNPDLADYEKENGTIEQFDANNWIFTNVDVNDIDFNLISENLHQIRREMWFFGSLYATIYFHQELIGCVNGVIHYRNFINTLNAKIFKNRINYIMGEANEEEIVKLITEQLKCEIKCNECVKVYIDYLLEVAPICQRVFEKSEKFVNSNVGHELNALRNALADYSYGGWKILSYNNRYDENWMLYKKAYDIIRFAVDEWYEQTIEILNKHNITDINVIMNTNDNETQEIKDLRTECWSIWLNMVETDSVLKFINKRMKVGAYIRLLVRIHDFDFNDAEIKEYQEVIGKYKKTLSKMFVMLGNSISAWQPTLFYNTN